DMPELRESEGLHWSYQLPGGILHNYITHPLYLALYFAGRPTHIGVSGATFGSLPQELTDQLSIQVKGDKCTVSVLVSLGMRQTLNDVCIMCQKGTVTVNFDAESLIVTGQNLLPRTVNRAYSNIDLIRQLSSQTIR